MPPVITPVSDPEDAARLSRWVTSRLAAPGHGVASVVPSGFESVAQIMPTIRALNGSRVAWTTLLDRPEGPILVPFEEMFPDRASTHEVDDHDVRGGRLRAFISAIAEVSGGHDQDVVLALWLVRSISREYQRKADHAVVDHEHDGYILFRGRVRELDKVPWSATLREVLPADRVWAVDSSWYLTTDEEMDCAWFAGSSRHVDALKRQEILDVLDVPTAPGRSA